MLAPSTPGTTQLLKAWAGGDQQALEVLVPRVYQELRRLAGHFIRHERPGNSIRATELVHEAYLRLIDVKQVEWQHQTHFFSVAATLMRRVLLDRARRRCAAKRGGRDGVDRKGIDLDEAVDLASTKTRDLIMLDDALTALAKVDPRKARIVELRFFGGLEVKETAEAVGVSADTVMRDWKVARAWLMKEIRDHR